MIAVDAGERADERLAVEIEVVAARLWLRPDGGILDLWVRGAGRALGPQAAEAVAERAHDGHVDGEPDQAQQHGMGRGRRLGREIGRFPLGDCRRHVHDAFYIVA
jgi:hypothetical protein